MKESNWSQAGPRNEIKFDEKENKYEKRVQEKKGKGANEGKNRNNVLKRAMRFLLVMWLISAVL